MRAASDTDAIEGIPLRLMIVAVIVAMSVLPAAQALEAMRSREFLARASQQLDEIAATAELVAVEGPGSARVLSLDFSSAGGLGFAGLRVGDAPEGPYSTTIALQLTNGGQMIRTLPDDSLAISGRDGDALVISSPLFDLRISAEYEKGVLWILAEVL